METPTRQKLAQAIAVRWTPGLAAQVRRGVEAGVARRRRRRALLIAVGFLLAGGTSFALSRGLLSRFPALRRGAPAAGFAPAPPTLGWGAPPVPAPPPPTAALREEAPVLTPPASSSDSPAPGALVTTRVPTKAKAETETVEALFARADQARLDGRFADAVAPLRAIFTRHPADPRAAIAAFQLGTVLADQLGDRRQAAHAFGRALALAPTGPLAKDAAARAAAAQDDDHARGAAGTAR